MLKSIRVMSQPNHQAEVADLLAWAKARTWFYAFELPDRTSTSTNVSLAVQTFHTARRAVMLDALKRCGNGSTAGLSCLDLASHEGFFSLALARETASVHGIDLNAESVMAAQRMAKLCGINNAAFTVGDALQIGKETTPADFVLLFGLLYHSEEPLRMLRIAAGLARRMLLIETQIAPFDIETNIEWGAYMAFNPVRGLFALVTDAPHREGGPSGFALVPSLRSLTYFLETLGFAQVRVLKGDFAGAEQLARGHRVIVEAVRA